MSTKAIVAIHGVGDQTEYATVQTVITQICSYYRVQMPVPLGRFHASTTAPVTVMAAPPDPAPLGGLAFAEVYWAEIPRKLVRNGYQLEETKRWGQTITNRLAQRAQEMNHPMPVREQRRLTTVIDEMVETIRILERANFFIARAGLFKFNLGDLLRNYVGDVQVVADFPRERDLILKRFDEVMTSVVQHANTSADAELYLVAHSEGSVVTFLALLKALSDPDNHKWVRNVRGLMTIGSPIETHHLFWPELWHKQQPAPSLSLTIPWRNYLDYSDPIAYPLQETSAWLKKSGFANHLQLHEIAFSRSALPGKAHQDYWSDDDVFRHFMDDVIFKLPSAGTKVPEPKTRPWAWMLSYAVPYALVVALIFLGTYFFFKPVVAALGMEGLGMKVTRWTMFRDVGGISVLLLGATVASRVPRLAPMGWSWVIAGVCFVATLFFYAFAVTEPVREALGSGDLAIGPNGTWHVITTTIWMTAVAAFLSSWFPRQGVKWLPLLGLVCAAVPILQLLQKAPDEFESWPLVIGGAAFFYLWWLAALVFDLVFVWHRFVRFAKASRSAARILEHGYESTPCEKVLEKVQGKAAGFVKAKSTRQPA